MSDPKKEKGEEFQDWRDHRLSEKSSEFKYSDSTEQNIHKGGDGFKYTGAELPEKM